ncbi:uncharacterized protein LOC122109510 isoform X2 [Dipodomys spectabilis]|uniref:uncharacterized protein LOC122109510 isoform X2 n=1 Tax=Dipodomys spectabilis TaxID=105255 RepID=UPI001C542BA2|nr:uncharacterized protein LOC122109510 isoform X2 [Dipodomys spectabilis]
MPGIRVKGQQLARASLLLLLRNDCTLWLWKSTEPLHGPGVLMTTCPHWVELREGSRGGTTRRACSDRNRSSSQCWGELSPGQVIGRRLLPKKILQMDGCKEQFPPPDHPCFQRLDAVRRGGSEMVSRDTLWKEKPLDDWSSIQTQLSVSLSQLPKRTSGGLVYTTTECLADVQQSCWSPEGGQVLIPFSPAFSINSGKPGGRVPKTSFLNTVGKTKKHWNWIARALTQEMRIYRCGS